MIDLRVSVGAESNYASAVMPQICCPKELIQRWQKGDCLILYFHLSIINSRKPITNFYHNFKSKVEN